ncbi:MAG: mechanosensitive ion channel family protein [Rubritepida sp.]|nr:mechanosensitive ion channel family protein [Rubritepida sp.]
MGGLLSELDASSPAAVLRSFEAETHRLSALYLDYRAAPTSAKEFTIARGLQRIATQLLDLSAVPPALLVKTGNRAVAELADVLQRLPPIPPETIPGNAGDPAALPAHWTIPGTELRLVRRTAGHRAGDYMFSAETVARLPEFHAAVIAQPPLRPTLVPDWTRAQERATGPWLSSLPLHRMPRPLQVPLLGTPIWKVALTVLLALGILLAVRGWRRRVHRAESDRLAPWRQRLRVLTVPGLFAVLVLAGHVFLNAEVILAGDFASAQSILATAALYIAAAWGAWHACWLLAEVVIASPSFPEDAFDANLMRVLARVLSIGAVAGILLYGANDIGVPALGLLAGVSIGGIALALAAQSTVENLLGGLSLFADRPFRVGDEVRHDGSTGVVEAIGPRSTRIRLADGTLTSVPNAVLAKAEVTNLSARGSTLFRHVLNLPAPLESARLQSLLDDMAERLRGDPKVLAGAGLPRVRLVGVADGALQIEVAARVATTVAPEFLEAQQRLLLEMLRAVEANGLALAPAPALSA